MRALLVKLVIATRLTAARWMDGMSEFLSLAVSRTSSKILTFINRWWLDLKTPACITNVQSVMKKRIELAKVRYSSVLIR